MRWQGAKQREACCSLPVRDRAGQVSRGYFALDDGMLLVPICECGLAGDGLLSLERCGKNHDRCGEDDRGGDSLLKAPQVESTSFWLVLRDLVGANAQHTFRLLNGVSYAVPSLASFQRSIDPS